jgi:hypothetical protein
VRREQYELRFTIYELRISPFWNGPPQQWAAASEYKFSPEQLLIKRLYGYNLEYTNNLYWYPSQQNFSRSGETKKNVEPFNY